MKRVFSIIMEYDLGLPTGTIAFWGTLVLRILTVDHTFLNRSKTAFVNMVYKVFKSLFSYTRVNAKLEFGKTSFVNMAV